MTSTPAHWLPVSEASHCQVQRASPHRIAILSTPRTGNTWLRYLFTTLYGATGLAIHDPNDLDWDALPAACVLQIHWFPEPVFLRRLEYYGFQKVVLGRHPLDVLISILQFSLHDPTECWLKGLAGNEQSIHGAMPCSEAFLNYATGPRAAALLSVSPAWWQQPGILKVRYEDLVQETTGELQRLTAALGQDPKIPLVDAVAAATIPKMRALTKNRHHFWTGKFGLWKGLLPAAQAQRIVAAHQEIFEQLGYGCDPDLTLETGQADANWIQMVWPDLAESLRNLKSTNHTLKEVQWQLQATQADLTTFRQAVAIKQEEVNSTCQLLSTSQVDLATTRHTLNEVRWQLQANQAELETLRRAVATKQDEVNSIFQLYSVGQADLASTKNTLTEVQRQLQETWAELEPLGRAVTIKQDEVNSIFQLYSAGQADLASTKNTLTEVQRQLQETWAELTAVRQSWQEGQASAPVLAEKETELQATKFELELTRQKVLTLNAEVNHLRQSMAPLAELGPLSFRIARSLGRYSRSFPILSALVKRLARTEV